MRGAPAGSTPATGLDSSDLPRKGLRRQAPKRLHRPRWMMRLAIRTSAASGCHTKRATTLWETTEGAWKESRCSVDGCMLRSDSPANRKCGRVAVPLGGPLLTNSMLGNFRRPMRPRPAWWHKTDRTSASNSRYMRSRKPKCDLSRVRIPHPLAFVGLGGNPAQVRFAAAL